MHEREKDAARIDIAAAKINSSAAEIAELVDGRKRSAETGEAIRGFTRGGSGGADQPERNAFRREKEIVAEMTASIEAIREASGQLQQLAAELRQPEITAAA